MHIILGATGHVGSAVANRPPRPGRARHRGHPRPSPSRAVHPPRCRRGGRRRPRRRSLARRAAARLECLPPDALADPATDTVAEERRTVAAIVRAVEGAELEKVVVQSTCGAQPGEGLGDLGVLYELERGVAAVDDRASIIRAAYYMSNWDSALRTARDEGVAHMFFPPDLVLPMVAPADVGRVAARLLTEEVDHTGVRYVEGPARYSPADVARAFARALGRDVEAVETPRSEWMGTFQALGFSPAAAASYAGMTEIVLESAERPEAPERGPTTLTEYIAALVRPR